MNVTAAENAANAHQAEENERTLKLHVLDPRRKGVMITACLLASMAMCAAAATLNIMGVGSPTQMAWLNGMAGLTIAATTIVMIRLGARITELEFWIRRMGAGDLEYTVPPRGHDELTEIAYDLEVLRERSLRSQELDLVRELSEAIQDKNETLESTLAELRNTQDQMISKQKLAEIGELAAGIAHEVRNPLNIISNYSVTSVSLMEELIETVNAADAADPEEREALISELSEDLTANMTRISDNCDRASRIIQDVTNMSRSQTSEVRPVEFNKMLHEYTVLAYQATRAQDQDFNVKLIEDYDDSIGEILCVPEEISRVFINIAQNACYATNERTGKTDTDEAYEPTITLTTRRNGESVIASVRDNGSGVPDDIAEKIFNPFFTTKPTNKGTGLGLSLSHEIVRRHGGSIDVESDSDSFTEMRVTLPMRAMPETVGASNTPA